MEIAPLPDNEAARLEALARYDILDTPPEEAFDDLTTLAAQICNTPIALIDIVDASRLWFKSKVGISTREASRVESSFCNHAIRQPNELLIVPDALEDERFTICPVVTSEPYVRFYAGAPLVTLDGFALGTLCVLDTVPRNLSPQQIEALRILSHQVMTQFELRYKLTELSQKNIELEQTKAQLILSQERFELALKATDEGLWEWHMATNEVYFSQQWKSMLGYEDGEIFENFDEWKKRIHPDDLHRVMAAIEAHLNELTPTYEIEHRLRHKNGSYRWILSRAISVRNSNGKPERMIGCHIDISVRKRAEQRQAVQHTTTHILAESATVEQAIQHILKAICETLGWDLAALWMPEDYCQSPIINSQCPNSQLLNCSNLWLSPSSKVFEFVEQLSWITFNCGVGLPGKIWQTGSPHWITNIVNDPNFLQNESARKDGLHSAFGFPILDARKVLGVMTFYSHSIEQPDPDLLDKMANIGSQIGQFIQRKQAELQLQETQDRLQAVMDNSTAVIFVKDALGRFQFINRRFENLFNVTNEQIQGKTDYDVFPKELADAFRQNDLDVLTSGVPLEMEEVISSEDGLQTYLSVKFPLLDPATGHPYAVCGMATDITERKRIEAALLESEKRLRKQQAALIELAQCQPIYTGNLAQSWWEIVETAAHTLGVERVSVWLYNTERSHIRCVDLYEASKNLHTAGTQLSTTDYPNYFQALETERVLAVKDVRCDARTQGFSESYLVPLGITSMLDVPIYVGGQKVGILSQKHVGVQRQWELEEQNFANYLAYMAALAIEAHERKRAQKALHAEQEKVERLLLNILPSPIVSRLKQEQGLIADSFSEATILFADIVGFTTIADLISPTTLIYLLNEIFSTFDLLTEKYGLEKIKIIGDAYMVAGGIPTPRSDHAEAIAELALDMQASITRFNQEQGEDFSIRIGINTGPVVAGVIGIKKFIYDLWGDAVNTASRMESHSLPGCIQMTESTYKLLRDNYLFEERGEIEVKGKGKMPTYLLMGRKGKNPD